jgi:hypothetical protein
MRRTQLYLEEDIWGALRVLARNEKTTISELVRVAVRERYFGHRSQRMQAMQAFVGSGQRSLDEPDTEATVRSLRRGDRLARLAEK